MAFTRLTTGEPNPSEFLQGVEGLIAVTDAQLEEELSHWQGVFGASPLDSPQSYIAQRVASDVMEPASLFRGADDELPPRVLIAREANQEALLFRGLSSLALSQLLRHGHYGPAVADGSFRSAPDNPAMFGIQPTDHPEVPAVHHPRDAIRAVLPDYVFGESPAWYADGPLVVETLEPAESSVNFALSYALQIGRFNRGAYITLRPQLLNTFVEHP